MPFGVAVLSARQIHTPSKEASSRITGSGSIRTRFPRENLMPIQPPFVACPLRTHIPVKLADLTRRSHHGLNDADKKAGALLLADALCDLLDHCFTDLLLELHKDEKNSQSIKAALTVTTSIKEKIHHYLGWIVSYISSERLVPVIAHYNSIVHEMTLHGQRQAHIVFPVDRDLARDASRVLAELHSGNAVNADEGMELLIQVIEAAMVPIIFTPKHLMKFNFLVDKTLNGVIAVIMVLFKHELRRLGSHMPREHYPQVARHLERFLTVGDV